VVARNANGGLSSTGSQSNGVGWESEGPKLSPGVRTPTLKFPGNKTQKFFRGGRHFFTKSIAPASGKELSNGNKAPNEFSSVKDTATYPVGPGDEILVNFWGEIQDTLLLTVNSQNEIFIPRLGAVKTAGLTFSELQKKMSRKINRVLKNVFFMISLYKPRVFQMYVLGSVGKPGPIVAQATMRASDIIGMAGGVEPNGSRQFIELRRGGNVLRVDLVNYSAYGDFSKNPRVTNGDVIFVPGISAFVSIGGAIAHPGVFEIKEVDHLSDVAKIMGGLTIYADHHKPIKLSRVTTGGRENSEIIYNESMRTSPKQLLFKDIVLKNGDEIFIPSTPVRLPSKSDAIFITGEVRAPGPKPFSVSTTFEEYIGMAGGVTSRADLTDAMVYKKDGTTVPVSNHPALEPGDSIYIPEKTFKFWQDHLTILTTFLTLATTVIALTR